MQFKTELEVHLLKRFEIITVINIYSKLYPFLGQNAQLLTVVTSVTTEHGGLLGVASCVPIPSSFYL